MLFTFTKIRSKKMQHLLKTGCKHYAELLGLRKDLRKNLVINLEFFFGPEDEDCGFCYWEDRRKKPREFTIQLDGRREPEEIMQDLAHEMVHVKQMARGELVDMQRGGWMWQGEEVYATGDKWKDYWYCPWEMEARAMERPMYLKFIEDFDPECETAKLLDGE